MKFGKELRSTVENSFPEWRPMFMSYKALKKIIHPSSALTALKLQQLQHQKQQQQQRQQRQQQAQHSDLLSSSCAPSELDQSTSPTYRPSSPSLGTALHCQQLPALTTAERKELARSTAEFFRGLRYELDKVNAFFLDKQEDYVILSAQLGTDVEDVIRCGASRADILKLKRRLVEFHGCLVLLDNFSHVNYQGFRKILKKLDKKTGLRVREAYLSSVAVTPFLLSDTVRHLLHDTESRLEQLNGVTKFRRGINDVSHDTKSSPAAGPSFEAGATVSSTSIAADPFTVVPGRAVSSRSSSDNTDDIGHSFDNGDAVESKGDGDTDSVSGAAGSSHDGLDTARTSLNYAQAQFKAMLHAMVTASALPAAYPRACIGPRSALYRVWRGAMAHVIAGKESCSVEQSLLDSINSVTRLELGINPPFMTAAPAPVDYVIAATPTLTMGFLVLRPDEHALQLFRRPRIGLSISRLMYGSAQMKLLASIDQHSDSEDTACSDAVPSSRDESQDAIEGDSSTFKLLTVRAGLAVGPWPAVSCPRFDYHVQWSPRDDSKVVIFYVMSSPLDTHQVERFALARTPLNTTGSSKFNSGEYRDSDLVMAVSNTEQTEAYNVYLKTDTSTFERVHCY